MKKEKDREEERCEERLLGVEMDKVCLCKDAIEDRLRGSTRTNISTDDSKIVSCV